MKKKDCLNLNRYFEKFLCDWAALVGEKGTKQNNTIFF